MNSKHPPQDRPVKQATPVGNGSTEALPHDKEGRPSRVPVNRQSGSTKTQQASSDLVAPQSSGSRQRVPVITPYILTDLKCLKRFRLLHGSGPNWVEGPFSRSRAFAKAVHRVLARALDPRFCSPPETRFIDTWSRDAILDPDSSGVVYADADLAHEDIVRCARVVRSVIDHADDASYTISVEHQFSALVCDDVGTPLFRLRPRADRLVYRPSEGTLTLIDYKIVAPSSFRPANRDQAALLVAAAEVERLLATRLPAASQVGFETWHVNGDDGELSIERLSSEDLRETYVALLPTIMRYINAKKYPAEPGAHCAGCRLFEECEEAQDIHVELRAIAQTFDEKAAAYGGAAGAI